MADAGPTLATASRVTYCLGDYEVTVPTGYGPRLLGLKANGSTELLIRLDSDVTLDAGERGTFSFRGGHRLWASPERPEFTYAPDDEPCAVSYENGILRVSGPIDGVGFGKELEVRLEGDRLVVDHLLSWAGSGPITAGPWAITQFPLGGTAFLPVGGQDGNPSLQANRSLVLWPYTDLADARLSFAPTAAIVTARRGPAFKLGSYPVPGRLGYLREGWLFTKTVEPLGEGDYPDLGAVGQVFVNEDFCELESLGAMSEMQPGDSLRHREVWRVVECPDADAALAELTAAR